MPRPDGRPGGAATIIRADSSLGLIPPKRLAALFTATRERLGWTLAQMAVASGGRFSVQELRRIEAGRVLLDDGAVRLLAAALGLSLESVVPHRARLSIDAEEGWMRSGSVATPVDGGIEEWQVLLRYLTLVYALRNVRAGQLIVPRTHDLEVLGEFLGRRPADVRRTLEQIMSGYRKELKASGVSMGRRIAIPALGVLVAVATLSGGLTLAGTGGPSRPAALEAGRPTDDDVEIGAALVLVNDDGPAGEQEGDPGHADIL